MKNFDWTSFTLKIAIKSTVSTLYNAWTVAEELEKWFLSNAKFINPAGVEMPKNQNFQTNDNYFWTWYLYDIVEEGKILEANNADKIQFSFAGDGVVEIKLTQSDENVIVQLTQKNIPTDDDSKQNIRLGCESGWTFFLVNLKSIYEGGIDLRNKNEKLKGMFNN